MIKTVLEEVELIEKRLFLILFIALSLLPRALFGQSWGYSGNRIAISADGNSVPDNNHKWQTADPDDWGATPAALAILGSVDISS